MTLKNKPMLKNYLVTAYRNIVKHKSYSFINILGFALGISCFLLIVDGSIPFAVTGVLEDVPYNSHFKFDFLASFITLENPGMRAYAGPITFWLDRRSNFFTYILLAQGASAEALERKLPDFMEKYSGELRRRLGTLNSLMPTLQHLPDIHLKSHLEREWEPNGNIRNVYILFAITVFVLLIACFNFMNLSTARSALRAQEVALRKLVGAERIRLVRYSRVH